MKYELINIIGAYLHKPNWIFLTYQTYDKIYSLIPNVNI